MVGVGRVSLARVVHRVYGKGGIMGKRSRRSRRLGCWSYVSRPGAVRNLPPYTMVESCDDGFQVVPDVDSLLADVSSGDVPYWDDCGAGYRGLAVNVTDHGNVSLIRVFANGNVRGVWGVV